MNDVEIVIPAFQGSVCVRVKYEKYKKIVIPNIECCEFFKMLIRIPLGTVCIWKKNN